MSSFTSLETDGVIHRLCEQFPDLLQSGNEPAIVFEYLLNRAPGRSNACVTPEKTKAGPAVIDVGCIEGKPMVTSPDNVAQMPLAIGKGTY